MVVLKQCCCGCSLRAGAIMIAIFFVVWSLVDIGTSANSLNTYHYIDDDLSAAIDKFNSHVYTDVENPLINTGDTLNNHLALKGEDGRLSSTMDKALSQTRVTKAELILGVFFSVIQFICGILLIYGAIQENAGILLPWVVVETLLLIAGTVMGIVSCIKAFAVIESTIAGSITVVWLVLYFLLSVYSLVIVYSYYRDLRGNPRPVRLIEESEDAEM
ncbi:uncharacterized protein LOC126106539 isoform X1 [Schistocerca cancellata]|uniref:uncharacterized protein LOC126106539 isoform X1 n=1 Tax=Schistocerca cancellata TaxID=274614 RepID=UPI002118D9E8|nr:uncharacterized protein LOC126106539 isoform X1 [Schistocerca cancellata]